MKKLGFVDVGSRLTVWLRAHKFDRVAHRADTLFHKTYHDPDLPVIWRACHLPVCLGCVWGWSRYQTNLTKNHWKTLSAGGSPGIGDSSPRRRLNTL